MSLCRISGVGREGRSAICVEERGCWRASMAASHVSWRRRRAAWAKDQTRLTSAMATTGVFLAFVEVSSVSGHGEDASSFGG